MEKVYNFMNNYIKGLINKTEDLGITPTNFDDDKKFELEIKILNFIKKKEFFELQTLIKDYYWTPNLPGHSMATILENLKNSKYIEGNYRCGLIKKINNTFRGYIQLYGELILTPKGEDYLKELLEKINTNNKKEF